MVENDSVKERFKHHRKENKTTHESVNVSFNLIEIFRLR